MTNIWRNAGSKDTKKIRNDTKTILDPYVGEALSISGSNVYMHGVYPPFADQFPDGKPSVSQFDL